MCLSKCSIFSYRRYLWRLVIVRQRISRIWFDQHWYFTGRPILLESKRHFFGLFSALLNVYPFSRNLQNFMDYLLLFLAYEYLLHFIFIDFILSHLEVLGSESACHTISSLWIYSSLRLCFDSVLWVNIEPFNGRGLNKFPGSSFFAVSCFEPFFHVQILISNQKGSKIIWRIDVSNINLSLMFNFF